MGSMMSQCQVSIRSGTAVNVEKTLITGQRHRQLQTCSGEQKNMTVVEAGVLGRTLTHAWLLESLGRDGKK
jgi:hypothetical protein